MMKGNMAPGNGSDIVQGKVYRGRKWNPETQKWIEAKFFNVALFEIDEKGMPIQKGVRKTKNKEEIPIYRIAKVFRVAESSLLKVANGESRSCNVYWSDR